MKESGRTVSSCLFACRGYDDFVARLGSSTVVWQEGGELAEVLAGLIIELIKVAAAGGVVA